MKLRKLFLGSEQDDWFDRANKQSAMQPFWKAGMKYDFLNVTFRTALDKEACREIIGSRTIEGREGVLTPLVANSPSEEDRQIISRFRGDRVKLYSPSTWSGLAPYFDGVLKVSSEGTILTGRMKIPDLGYVIWAVLLLGLGAFALLWPIGLIVRIVSGDVLTHESFMLSELKRLLVLVGPLQVASLWLVCMWYFSRNQRKDIYDFFRRDLKAKRLL